MAKKLYVLFELTMPNKGSWNGKWSGENDRHIVTRMVSEEQLEKLLERKHYFYSWNDGWGASIEVTQIDSKERVKLNRKNYGFAGYEWMVSSILANNKILAGEY